MIHEKVKKRRIELGLSETEVSNKIGFQQNSMYQDVEFNDDEITDSWDISNVKKLIEILKFDYFELFDLKCAFCELGEKYLDEYKLPRNELLKTNRIKMGLSEEKLGDEVGWKIEEFEKSDAEFDNNPIMAMTDINKIIRVPLQILVGIKCKKCGR